MLSVDDMVKDFDAICDQVDHEGRPQPPFVPTVAENLVDLGWHQKEFELRRSFASPSSRRTSPRVLGSVYVNPSETHDARADLWVRRSASDEGLDRRGRAHRRSAGTSSYMVRNLASQSP